VSVRPPQGWVGHLDLQRGYVGHRLNDRVRPLAGDGGDDANGGRDSGALDGHVDADPTPAANDGDLRADLGEPYGAP
jgi:hypothetical protein